MWDRLTLGPYRRRRWTKRAFARLHAESSSPSARVTGPRDWTPATVRKPRGSWRTRSLVGVGIVIALIALSSVLPGRMPGFLPGSASASDLPPAGFEASDHALATPPVAPPGAGGYTFNQTLDDGVTPVRWDPCRPIHYVTAGDAPIGGHLFVEEAVAVISAATGLQFINDGVTDESVTGQRASFQPDRYPGRWAPLLVAWTDPAERPELKGDVIGVGGGVAYFHADSPAAYVTGVVYLDEPAFTEALAISLPGIPQAVVTHELGHAIGLGHVADPTQIMYPETGLSVTAPGSGDLRGLAILGAGPCQPDL